MPIKPWVGGVVCGPLKCDPMLLIQRSRNIDPKYPLARIEEKFIGGMWEETDGPKGSVKSFFRTLNREFFRETDFKVRDGNGLKIIYNGIVVEKWMVLYLIPFENLIGQMREDKERIDGDTMLLDLHWETLESVVKELHSTHRTLFWKVLEKILDHYEFS